MNRPDTAIPDLQQQAALNAALLATGAETGFWDDHGRPAHWPGDIHEWRQAASEPFKPAPGQQPF